MRVRIGLTLLVVIFLVGSLLNVTTSQLSARENIGNSPSIDSDSTIPENHKEFKTSDHTISGVLDPLLIEQLGNWTTQSFHAETDSGIGTTGNLEIDTANSWLGDTAYATLWNLERLYVENGTLSTGVAGTNINPTGSVVFHPDGWDAISYQPIPTQDMLAGYASGAISVSSDGDGAVQTYDYYNGSYVYWMQEVDNTPYLEFFTFSMDYYYGTQSAVNENVTLRALVNDNPVWSINASVLEVGGSYTTGDISLDLTGIGSEFNFSVGLYFDGDVTHTRRSIEFVLDNIRLVGTTPPAFNDNSINFNINGDSTVITGNSIGTAKIVNSSYWNSTTVPFSFSSDLAVSFDYNSTILNHRFTNSTYTITPGAEGVTFNADVYSGISLDLFTYHGGLPNLDNFSITVYHPSDWENTTVYNPFLTDVTSSCTQGIDRITIPESLLYSLGWWQLTLDANNYMNTLSSKKSTTGTDPWDVQTVFNTSEYIRGTSSISYGVEYPVIDDSLNISLYLPNGTLWYSELITGGSGDLLNSTGLYLDSSNTTAGEWTLAAFWQNGTEIAFGETHFDVHHESELIAVEPSIQTEMGTVYKTSVIFRDIESDEFIMDASSVIVANWSGLTITFEPNINQNSWEANFDTSLVGAGSFTILVNATGTFHYFAQTSFVLVSILTDNTLDIAVSSASTNLQENYTVDFTFKDKLSVGIPSADVTIDFDGPASGLMWGDVDDLGAGNYRVNISASISGSYSITITANGTYYESAKDVFVLDVGTLAASLDSANGSIATIGYGQSYRLVLRYTNGTGHGLIGADIGLASIVPATGLSPIGPVDHGDGNYSFILSPDIASTYTLLFEANITNHDRKLFTFTISVTDLSSILTIESSDEFIDIDQNSTIIFRYVNDTGHGIDGATFEIISPPAGLSFSDVRYLGDGYYELNVTPTQIGQYQLRFKASADNYLDATAAVPLGVSLVNMELVIEFPQAEYSTPYGTDYEISFYLQRLNESGYPIYNITNAIFDIEILGVPGLECNITPEEEHIGNYVLTMQADTIDSWEVTILASKALHETSEITIAFSINRISTGINDFESRDFIYGRTYLYTFEYVVDSDSSSVEGATLSISGRGSEFITWEESESSYVLILIPLDIGSYSVDIEFSKEGYQTQTSTIVFEVSSVPIRITTDSNIIWNEFLPLNIEVILVISDLNQTLSNASVVIDLYSGGSLIQEFPLDEGLSGVYSGSITSDYWQETDMIIQVTVQKQYHLTASSQIRVQTIRATLAELIVRNSIPISVVSVLMLISVLAIVSTRRRNRNLRRESLEIKSTFDDANNLLGILVLHKSSGLPFYSKILKGGFEEGMLSAFITAVTHFRSEFEHNGAEPEWKLTPISDIIRAGVTRNLICAFVTMTSPSLVHEAKMVMFTREIGLLLDDRMEVPPTEFRDADTGRIIDDMFDDYLDGYLLKEYCISIERALPRKYRCISEARAVAGLGDTFSLSELSRGLEACGIEDAKGYKLITDAVEGGYVWPIKKDVEDSVPEFSE